MTVHRRTMLRAGAVAAAGLGAGGILAGRPGPSEAEPRGAPDARACRYRIAFGAWINDMRRDPLPLEDWPAPQLDDEALESAAQAMDLQAEAGFNMVDVWGLFGTCPGPATWLKEPCLGPEGRKEHRKGLMAILEEIPRLAGACEDGGRLAAIRRSVIVTLNLLNTVSYCMGEPIP